jgi:hypothetical protein
MSGEGSVKYVVSLGGGYYYRDLGGGWCRTSQDSATRFDTREEAERVARTLERLDADVEEEEGL